MASGNLSVVTGECKWVVFEMKDRQTLLGGNMFRLKEIFVYCFLLLLVFVTACGELPDSQLANNPVNKPTLEALAGSSTPSDIEAELLEKINAIRTQGHACRGDFYASSDALVWNAALAGAAKTHVKDVLEMHAQGKIDVRSFAPPHIGSNGLRVDSRAKSQGYAYKTIAENLASASNASPNVDKVLESWLVSSKGHCEVLVLAELEDIGLYFENGVWTAVFGTPG